MGARLEELERPKAEERRNAKLLQNEGDTVPENFRNGGDTRDVVGEALGVSGKTYEKAKAIAETAIGPLKAMVDTEQGSIDAAATVAKLPKIKQAKIVKKGPDAGLLRSRYGEGRTLRDVAAIHDTTPAAVTRRIGRTLATMGRKLR